jgi:hypothetical protein
MTDHEDPSSAGLDAYVSAQLDKAAETHASQVDIRARLESVRRQDARQSDPHDAIAAER